MEFTDKMPVPKAESPPKMDGDLRVDEIEQNEEDMMPTPGRVRDMIALFSTNNRDGASPPRVSPPRPTLARTWPKVNENNNSMTSPNFEARLTSPIYDGELTSPVNGQTSPKTELVSPSLLSPASENRVSSPVDETDHLPLTNGCDGLYLIFHSFFSVCL